MHIATQSVVTTERLTLRQLCHDDLTFITGLLGDAEVIRFHHDPYTPEDAAAWLNQQLDLYKAGEPGMWLVLNSKTGKPVGVVGLVAKTIEDAAEIEIVYLIHRRHWRRGYGTEAAFAVRSLARDKYGYSRLISVIHPDDVPSLGVARRLGMQPERALPWNGSTRTLFASAL